MQLFTFCLWATPDVFTGAFAVSYAHASNAHGNGLSLEFMTASSLRIFINEETHDFEMSMVAEEKVWKIYYTTDLPLILQTPT